MHEVTQVLTLYAAAMAGANNAFYVLVQFERSHNITLILHTLHLHQIHLASSISQYYFCYHISGQRFSTSPQIT